jgi:Lar family restriction alleviation protein
MEVEMMDNTQTVKTCPFCGKQPTIKALRFGDESSDRYGVACRDCAICIGWDVTEDEAVRRWNTRVS